MKSVFRELWLHFVLAAILMVLYLLLFNGMVFIVESGFHFRSIIPYILVNLIWGILAREEIKMLVTLVKAVKQRNEAYARLQKTLESLNSHRFGER